MSRLHLLVVLLGACTADGADTAAEETDADTDTDTDTDTDSDTDTDTDTAPAAEGLLHFVGTATVLDAYAGTEVVTFSDTTSGAELCRITLSLASTGTRTDCAECDWAFTVEVLDAVTELDTACAAAGWGDPAAAVGTSRGYGYVALYFGHAPVLMLETDGAWEPGAYASFDAGTGALSYDREAGLYPY